MCGSVNTNIAGIYEVEYFITDSDGNTSTARRIVLVNDGSFIISEYYIIQARDFIRRVSEVDTSADGMILAASARAFRINEDWTTSDILVSVVETDGFGAYVRKLSNYF